MTPRKDDLWRPGDYDDEPRIPGEKSSLDLFRERIKAAADADKAAEATMNAFRHAAAEAAERERGRKKVPPSPPPVPESDR